MRARRKPSRAEILKFYDELEKAHPCVLLDDYLENRREELAAFDSLPKIIRMAMTEAVVDISACDVAETYSQFSRNPQGKMRVVGMIANYRGT